jgi:adenylosuccinate lyase
MDLEFIQFIKKNLKGKGMKGAVGTSASYISLLGKKAKEMEEGVLKGLGIDSFDITNQTSPRKIEVWIGNLLSSIAQSLYKFAFDLRIMQSSNFGEWQEPFGPSQVGSSAMPFKKNPIKSEQICSLARLIVSQARVLWDNASHMLLERTLDDSANRRVVIPEIFLATDEILTSTKNIVEGLMINEQVIIKNLDFYWIFSASELIIVESVKKGADRQKMHEVLREISMTAWKDMHEGKSNPMADLIKSSDEISKYLSNDDLKKILDVEEHVGNAKEKSGELVKKLQKLLTKEEISAKN